MFKVKWIMKGGYLRGMLRSEKEWEQMFQEFQIIYKKESMY